MSKINLLDSTLISKIAAGEVLERPSSCLKELIDNAIDSNATEIIVKIENGGMALISVDDNGDGIEKDDLVLAVTKHATSKIKSFDDLVNVATLGFRGEALASCCAVARVKITSKSIKERDSWYIEIAEGIIKSPPIQTTKNIGTLIEVKDIFHFVPARRAFLKSATTEATKCLSVFLKFALTNPNIEFKFFKDKKLVYSFKKSTFKQRWIDILKIQDENNIIEINETFDDYNVNGYLLKKKSVTDISQLTYVNNRIVNDKIFNHACKEALRASGAIERDFNYIIFLSLPKNEVDVNVHPEKKEVRFKNAQKTHQLIFKALKDSLPEERNDNNFMHLNDNNYESNNDNIFEPIKLNNYLNAEPVCINNQSASLIAKTSSGGWIFENNNYIYLFNQTSLPKLFLASTLLNEINLRKDVGVKLLFNPIVNIKKYPNIIRFRKQLETIGLSFLEMESDNIKLLTLPVGFESCNINNLINILNDTLMNSSNLEIICSKITAAVDDSLYLNINQEEPINTNLHFNEITTKIIKVD